MISSSSSSGDHSSDNNTSNNNILKRKKRHNLPQIVIVRHGERADKYPDLKPLQEPENCNLTETGFIQAMGIGKCIRDQYDKNKYKLLSSNKWRIVSSPFTRTLQTASAIMSSLGPECCESGKIEVDFECGERLKVLEVPEGVVKLTEDRASEIVRKGYEFCTNVRKTTEYFSSSSSSISCEDDQVAETSTSSFEPGAKFGYGDASCVHPAEKLEAGGLRLYRAINRLYDQLLLTSKNHHQQQQHGDGTEDDDNNETPLPNLLVVTHGYAPSQLLKILYGREAIDATRVFLCSAMCLQSFEGLSEKTQNFIMSRQIIEKQEHEHQQTKPRFTVLWTRGVKWRIPQGQPRVVISSSNHHHQTSSSAADPSKSHNLSNSEPSSTGNSNRASSSTLGVPPSSSSSKTKNYQDQEQVAMEAAGQASIRSNAEDCTNEKEDGEQQQQQQEETNQEAGEAKNSIFQKRFSLTLDQDQIFHSSPYSTAAEEPDVHGVIEKVWYESKAVNVDKPEKCYLGFSLDPDSPPPLIPIVAPVVKL